MSRPPHKGSQGGGRREGGGREHQRQGGAPRVWRAQQPAAAPASQQPDDSVMQRIALSEIGPGGYRQFGDIPAYKKGRALRGELYRLANALPADEKHNLAARIKYAATTVTAALAAGFGMGEMRSALTRALESRGALCALQDHLEQAAEQGWLDQPNRESLSKQIDETIAALNEYLGELARDKQRLCLEPK